MPTPTYINSNMTNREALRIFGALPDDRLDDAITAQEWVEDSAGEVDGYIDAACDSLPAEDFLETGGLKDLREFFKRYRGRNRGELESIIETLAETELNVMQQANAAREELSKAQALLAETMPLKIGGYKL